MFHERPKAGAFKLGSQRAQQRFSCAWEGYFLLAMSHTKHPRLEQKPYTDRRYHEFSVCYAGIRFSYQHTTQKCHELINSQTTLAFACHPVPLPQMLEGAQSAMLLFALSGSKVDFPKTVGSIKAIMVFLRGHSKVQGLGPSWEPGHFGHYHARVWEGGLYLSNLRTLAWIMFVPLRDSDEGNIGSTYSLISIDVDGRGQEVQHSVQIRVSESWGGTWVRGFRDSSLHGVLRPAEPYLTESCNHLS